MKRALIIGAGSAIAGAIQAQLAATGDWRLIAVSRQPPSIPQVEIEQWHPAPSDDPGIAQLIDKWRQQQMAVDLVCICIGLLHSEEITPERRLADLDMTALQQLFSINALLPICWVKHLLPWLKQGTATTLVVMSARIGSITDNQLGGWYGYRASKAALNMLMKTAAVEYAREAPRVRLICFHPGTTDSPLSRPFQRRLPPGQLQTPANTARRLLALIEQPSAAGGLRFIDWQGKTVPW